MKKVGALFLILCMFLPMAVYATNSIDLSMLTDEELETLIQDITREVLVRKGFSPATPTPVPSNTVQAETCQLEITGGRLYTRYSTITLQLSVKNLSEEYTVDAFDVSLIAYNNYGEQVYSGLMNDPEKLYESNVNIKPGKTHSDRDAGTYWSLYSLSEATKVNVSISRYHFKDSDTVVVPDEKRVWVTFELE